MPYYIQAVHIYINVASWFTGSTQCTQCSFIKSHKRNCVSCTHFSPLPTEPLPSELVELQLPFGSTAREETPSTRRSNVVVLVPSWISPGRMRWENQWFRVCWFGASEVWLWEEVVVDSFWGWLRQLFGVWGRLLFVVVRLFVHVWRICPWLGEAANVAVFLCNWHH